MDGVQLTVFLEKYWMNTTSDDARDEQICLATRVKVCQQMSAWPRVANKATLIRNTVGM